MDPLLLALVIVSLLAATGFAGFAWHLLREERRRSAARVASLSAALEAPTPATTTPGVGELFAPQRSAAAHGNPLIKVAVGVAMAVVLILVIAGATSGTKPADESVPTASAAPVASTRGAAPLELISMRHSRQGETLTVSGLVRNPRSGGNMTRVIAVVLAFNRAGAFVASGRAALDFTTLEPGDESPFVVSIPSISEVGRYRVSFRTDAGVVRHVDRRSDQTRLAAVHLQ